MNHRTHRNLSKAFFPHIPNASIDKIHHRLDSPKPIDKTINTLYDPKAIDTFGLTRHGHRKVNHDPIGAMLAGYMVDPNHGIEIAMSHQFEDLLGNVLHDAVGTETKELVKAALNLSFAPKKRKYKQMTNFINTNMNRDNRRYF
jgi:hypothetical protein